MTTIDIFSGFLGAGKTTLIKKLIREAYAGQQLVLIENEFGEIGIDGGFMQEAGIQINELNSGCICCSLVGDFRQALRQVMETYHPERILIEPSGVGKLSDVVAAVSGVTDETVSMGAFVTVVDATKCRMYMKNFGEFYNNQVENATTIVLSRSQNLTEEARAEVMALLREHNATARIVTTPWDEITGEQIAEAMNGGSRLAEEMMAALHEHHHHHDDDEDECDDPDCECHHHHHDEDDEDEHEHHHHHHHDDDEDEHEHEHHHHHHHDDDDEDECDDPECECHHHHHDEDEDEHEHPHHHHHDDDDEDECDDPECECHHHHHNEDEDEHEHHHHHHHHHHHADEVFTSWGAETARRYTPKEVSAALSALDTGRYGAILRAKGILPAADGSWIHFDYVPFEQSVRTGTADYTGRLCVIGSKLDEPALAALFLVQ